MIFKREAWLAKKDRLGQWHRWFAWHPVVGDDFVAWLCYVERSGEFSVDTWFFEYRIAK